MQQISPIKEKILYYIEYKGISKYKFYQESGITRGVLDKESGISEENIAKYIAYAPEVNLEWLFLNKGEMIKTKNDNNVVNFNEHKNDHKNDHKPKVKETWSNDFHLDVISEPNSEYANVLRKIKFAKDISITDQGAPFYPMPISAGTVAELLKEPEKPNGFISIPGVSCKAYFPVIGCSFEPYIKAGGIIGVDFIDRWEILDPDCIYFIITHDQRMLKRLQRDPDNDGKMLCISPNYKSFSIDINDIKVIHKVVFYGSFV